MNINSTSSQIKYQMMRSDPPPDSIFNFERVIYINFNIHIQIVTFIYLNGYIIFLICEYHHHIPVPMNLRACTHSEYWMDNLLSSEYLWCSLNETTTTTGNDCCHRPTDRPPKRPKDHDDDDGDDDNKTDNTTSTTPPQSRARTDGGNKINFSYITFLFYINHIEFTALLRLLWY